MTLCCKPAWKLSDKMEEFGVVPDVIDKIPDNILTVIYLGYVRVREGNELTPTTVKDKPVLNWNPDDDESFYLLLMTDPDAPCRENPIYGEWQHWLVGNIPGNNIQLGDTLSEYIGAGPPKDTSYHRYVFLLYKQLAKINFDETKLTNRSPEGRPNFNTRDFAEKYDLGDPIAGNFFQARWDMYVPILHQQLLQDETSECVESSIESSIDSDVNNCYY